MWRRLKARGRRIWCYEVLVNDGIGQHETIEVVIGVPFEIAAGRFGRVRWD